MPEGPEVRSLADRLSALEGRMVRVAKVHSGRYIRAGIHDFDRLVESTLERVTVKGKLLVLQFIKDGERFAVLSTMGMTGWWHVGDPVRSHLRILLDFDGTFASFQDQRNFGTFKIVSLAEVKRKKAELGADILTERHLWESLAIPEFKARLTKFAKRMSLAEAILDQRIAAGCGHYIRADAMYLASLSPHRKAIDLSDKEIRLIWECMHHVAVCALQDRHPSSPEPRAFQNVCYGRSADDYGHSIEFYTDATGRTVWWCPAVQSEP